MFTPQERERLRAELLEYAGTDSRISGAAVTGSAADRREDRWSDIDLAFGVGNAADVPEVIAGWTARMYESHQALHHLDVLSGAWVYRVFFLASSLQVDLAFVAASEFRALAPTFRLMFGTANEARHAQPQPPEGLIGLGWLYALHARSSIARGKLWQAEYMVSGVRGHVLALACIRHGLPAAHGRGMDLLPKDVLAGFEESLVRQFDLAELSRAFQAVVRGLQREIRSVDKQLAARLDEALSQLATI